MSDMAMREATHEEWAANLFAGSATEALVAQALAAAEARGRRRERSECRDLAYEHALTIDEASIADTPFGLKMTEQERITIASEMRHVAQYVGALIARRDLPTEQKT